MEPKVAVEQAPYRATGHRPHRDGVPRLYMIASGERVSQIAKELSLSVKTVKTHRSRILMKMKMSSNAELIHYAIRNSLVSEIMPRA